MANKAFRKIIRAELYLDKLREQLIMNMIKTLKKDGLFAEAFRWGIETFVKHHNGEIVIADANAIQLQQEQIDKQWQLLEQRQVDLDRRERELELERREIKLAQDEKLQKVLDAITAMQSQPSISSKGSMHLMPKDKRESDNKPAAQHEVEDVDYSNDADIFSPDDVRKDTASGANATKNFLASMSSLIGEDITQPAEPQRTEGNATQLTNVTFDAPPIDDDDDDLF